MMIQALGYLRQGLAVIPITPGRKNPPLVKFKEDGFTTRLPTEQEVTDWWTKYPEANIGCVTGKVSGISVIEADKEKGGYETLKTLPFQSKMLARSGGGGLHCFFNYTDRVKTWVGKLGPGVDVRNDGGYIILAPSVHPSGFRYSWLNPTGFNRKFLGSLESLDPISEVNKKIILPSAITDALGDIKPGMRHYQFSRVIGRLNRLGVKDSEIFTLLQPHAEKLSFNLTELKSQITRMCALYADQAPVEENQPAYDLSKFLEEEEAVEWIAPDLLARKSIGFIAGLPGSLKTWLLIDLAIEAAKGGLWLDRFKLAKCKVLYIDQERFKGETKRRFASLIRHKEIDPTSLNSNLRIQCGSTFRLNLQHSFDAFDRDLDEFKPDLVLIDSFNAFHSTTEESRTDMQSVMERVKTLRTTHGCTFVFIDHEPKGVAWRIEEGKLPSSLDMVGSPAKSESAEFVFNVRSESDTISIVHHTKSTLGPTIAPFSVKIEDATPDKTKIKIGAMWTIGNKESTSNEVH